MKAFLASDGRSIASILQAHKGATNGFDYIRIALAILILAIHTITTTSANDAEVWTGLLRPLPAVLVPMFFCLSGFLVSGSLARTANTREFLLLRAIRIVPALAVEIVLSALLLGTLFTTVPLSVYFTSPEFYAYFLNIFGIVHYYLPGLFLDNPTPGIVNGNLWTLPFELYCYAALAVLVLFRVTRYPGVFALLVLTMLVINHFPTMAAAEGLHVYRPTGRTLVLSFLAGVVFFLNQHRIVMHRTLFLIAAALTYVLLLNAGTQILAVLPMTYATVYLGLANPEKRGFLFSGDYSYGLYLFGCPLQQLYVMLFPDDKSYIGNLMFALTLGLGYAWLSWNLVEKPVLLKKRQIIARFELLWSGLARLLPPPLARAWAGATKSD